jgi:hypothetical protein
MKKTCGIVIRMIACVLVFIVMLGQQVSAQSVSEYETTLGAMGYADRVAYGPKAIINYYFNLPAHWEIVDGSYIILYLEYDVLLAEGTTYPPALLNIQLNDYPLHTAEMAAPVTQRMQLSLSGDQFRLYEDAQANMLRITFREYGDCESDILSTVTIKHTSVLHLVYRERSLPIDLALLPRPIYQSVTFDPSPVRFVLPDEYTATDVRAAAIVAARLGQLTAHRLPISAMLASEWPSHAVPGEHLIVLGSPDENPVIGQLELPVPLVERQLALRSQMPMTVSRGSVFSYTLLVENTTSDAQSLTVEDRFSHASARFLGCAGSCDQVASGKVRWDVGLLAAGQQASTTVTLTTVPAVSLDPRVRHTATLLDSQGMVLNVDTLVTQIGERPDSRRVTSAQQKSTRFFVQGSQAIPEDGGMIQEIVSPQNASRVALIVTGLNGEALLKAAYGLNPRNRFPGIAGQAAIVEDVRLSARPASAPPREVSFASLGYGNAELNVLDLEARDYLFDLPPGSALSEDSYLALHFAHAAIVSTVGGGIKITLNGVPIGSISLDDSNLGDAWLQVPLGRTPSQPGLGRIRIKPTVSVVERCIADIDNSYWFEIYADSFLHLGYRPTLARFDLGYLPYPFNRSGDMGDVLFALSDTPSLSEIEGLLRVASLLGSGSSSQDLMPRVTFGGDADLTSLSSSHVLAIGLPVMNPVIRSANSWLPQPFIPDSNDVHQSIDGPIYGIPPGTDLGFVQEMVSPWDREGTHAFVVATGTTEEGVGWAVSAIAQLSEGLRGDLAVVRGDEVYGTDTRPVVAEEVLTRTVSLTPTPASAATDTPVGAVTETPMPEQASEQAAMDVMPTVDRVPPGSVDPPRPKRLVPLLVIAVGVSTLVGAIVWTVRKAH